MPNTLLSAVNGWIAASGAAIAMIGAAIKLGPKWLDARQIGKKAKDKAQARRAGRMRAARENAVRLETFAHACDALVIENTRVARDCDEGQCFHLPALDEVASTGNDAESLRLELAYRDFQREIVAAQDHIGETCRDGFHAGHEEGLIVLHYSAYRLAALALMLAERYRAHLDVPRAPAAARTLIAEQTIRERAAEDAHPGNTTPTDPSEKTANKH